MEDQSYLPWNKISHQEFEKLCQFILGSLGFTNAQGMGGPGDRGRDVVCELTIKIVGNIAFNTKWVVQCKHYTESPKITLLQGDLSKALQHEPDFWLLMTSATLSPAVYDWIRSVDNNKTYKFRLLVLDGTELSRIILEQPAVAYQYKDKLFVKDRTDYSKVMDLMGKGKYADALNRILKTSKETPRLLYLEACCRSMLLPQMSNRNNRNKKIEMAELAFEKLENALKTGYVDQMNSLIGWPKEKVVYEIERDHELEPLKLRKLSRFNEILGIIKPKISYTRSGGGCLVGETPIRVISGTDKPISSIGVGDIIPVPGNHSKGEVITNTFQVTENYIVSINNKISCSLSQPFLTTGGFKKAVELKRGDILVKENNNVEPIINLRYEDKMVDMFMLALSGKHLFYAADYIIHNKMMD